MTFRDAVLAGGIPTTLPFTINNTARNVYLRFNVPDYNRIVAINSIDVTVRLHDDVSDPVGNTDEAAFVAFALRMPDPDFFFGFVDPLDLEGTTPISPFVFNYSLDPFEISSVFPTLIDNEAFRIRISRCCGDFLVVDGSVTIDAQLAVPAPGTLACLGAGLACLAWVRRRRRDGN